MALAKIFAPAERAQDLWVMATLGGDRSGLFTRIPPGRTFLSDEEPEV